MLIFAEASVLHPARAFSILYGTRRDARL